MNNTYLYVAFRNLSNSFHVHINETSQLDMTTFEPQLVAQVISREYNFTTVICLPFCRDPVYNNLSADFHVEEVKQSIMLPEALGGAMIRDVVIGCRCVYKSEESW